MSTCRRIVAVLGVVAFAAGTTLQAQRTPERQGFWIAFGFGYGSAGFSCDSCTGSGRDGALSGFLKMGGRLGPRLLLGGESNGWVHRRGDTTETRGNVSVAAYFYPALTSGLFVKGGVGFSRYSSSGGFVDWRGSGIGLVAGAGYDARVGRNVSLTPVINWFFGSLGTVDAPGYAGSGGYTHNVVQVALGITFH